VGCGSVRPMLREAIYEPFNACFVEASNKVKWHQLQVLCIVVFLTTLLQTSYRLVNVGLSSWCRSRCENTTRGFYLKQEHMYNLSLINFVVFLRLGLLLWLQRLVPLCLILGWHGVEDSTPLLLRCCHCTCYPEVHALFPPGQWPGRWTGLIVR